MNDTSIAMLTLSLALVSCMNTDHARTATATAAAIEAPIDVVALVTGPLAATSESQALDALSRIPPSMARGEVSHDGFLNRDPGALRFLAIDGWRNAGSASAFYASAPVRQGFGELFAASPDVSVWTTRDGWKTWGSVSSAREPNAYTITLRGRIQGDAAQGMSTHNHVVDAVPAPGPVGQGNSAHLPLANPDDPAELLIVEVWTNRGNQEALYSDPQFQKALGQFWVRPPQIAVWRNPNSAK